MTEKFCDNLQKNPFTKLSLPTLLGDIPNSPWCHPKRSLVSLPTLLSVFANSLRRVYSFIKVKLSIRIAIFINCYGPLSS